ncbi:hypothetical protein ARMGADRAFT_1079861 [Armillaria gallica]|uniref:Uncharacterized protein n=1 Tax=Armillaria gallica TaxID=47427 RepID=A0A2H3DZ19_ARMGA|nr:hypothetical protein ARMGADRAFT_1079861 [Armillaria gallica]
MLVSGLLPELLDDIIDELQGDKKSLLGASLACKALCPRTRVHLFSVVALSGKSACDRLRGLITLSPKLALHFRTLYNILNVQNDDASAVYGALTVIESLVNVTDLTLLTGDWRHVPDTVVQVNRRDLLTLEEFAQLAIHDVHLQNCYGGVRFGSLPSLHPRSSRVEDWAIFRFWNRYEVGDVSSPM